MVDFSAGLRAFAAHRLEIQEDDIMDVWLGGQNTDPELDWWTVNPECMVYCSFMNRGNRKVQVFSVKYRELVASIKEFAR